MSGPKLLIVTPRTSRSLGEFLQDHFLQSEPDTQLWTGDASDFSAENAGADICLIAVSENRLQNPELNESWLIPIARKINQSPLELCAYLKTSRQYELVREHCRGAETVSADISGNQLKAIDEAVDKCKARIAARRQLIEEALEWDRQKRPLELLTRRWHPTDEKIPSEHLSAVSDFLAASYWYRSYLSTKEAADHWHSEGRPPSSLASISDLSKLTDLRDRIPLQMGLDAIVESFIADSLAHPRPAPESTLSQSNSQPRYSKVSTDSDVRATPKKVAAKAPRVRNPVLDCSVFSPPKAPPQSKILIQVALHDPEQFEDAAARAAIIDSSSALRGTTTLELKIPLDARIDIFLEEAAGLEVESPVQSAVWRGRMLTVNFVAVTPRSEGPLFPKIRLSCNGAVAAELRFKIDVEHGQTDSIADQPVIVKRYKRVFFSYSSQDRVRVLEVAQSYRALGVEFFQDILSLEPGQRWEQGLYQEIDACDLFLLFWSRSSSSSEWVAKEASYALEQQSRSTNRKPEIIPLILDGPPPPPPPEFLKHLHFNDWMRYAIESAKPPKETTSVIETSKSATETSKAATESTKPAATRPQDTTLRTFGAIAPAKVKANPPNTLYEPKAGPHSRESAGTSRTRPLTDSTALYLGSGFWIFALLAASCGIYWLFK
jgi:TIR domain